LSAGELAPSNKTQRRSER